MPAESTDCSWKPTAIDGTESAAWTTCLKEPTSRPSRRRHPEAVHRRPIDQQNDRKPSAGLNLSLQDDARDLDQLLPPRFSWREVRLLLCDAFGRGKALQMKIAVA